MPEIPATVSLTDMGEVTRGKTAVFLVVSLLNHGTRFPIPVNRSCPLQPLLSSSTVFAKSVEHKADVASFRTGDVDGEYTQKINEAKPNVKLRTTALEPRRVFSVWERVSNEEPFNPTGFSTSRRKSLKWGIPIRMRDLRDLIQEPAETPAVLHRPQKPVNGYKLGLLSGVFRISMAHGPNTQWESGKC